MVKVSSIVKQLKKERDKVERQLSGYNAAISAFAGVYAGKTTRKKRTMSAAARKRFGAAQKKRWAKVRAQKKAA
jgi:hypothetical protein